MTIYEQPKFGLTDLGNSERFIAHHGNNIKYCVELKQWHIFDGTLWVPDNLGKIHQLAKATVGAIYAELVAEPDSEKKKALFKFIQTSESERSLGAMVSLAKTDPRIVISAEKLDLHLHLLNCLNGTIDLRTGELLAHRREDLITKQCPVKFDINATSTAWERFLNDCTRGDREYQAGLQRAVGYSLYGDPREQVLFVPNGKSNSGKSTLITVISHVLGTYATTADFTTFLKKDRVSSGPSDDIANLAGARFVSSSEVDKGKELAQALVKQLTGGDMIRARQLYKDSFQFRPQFALWLVCNHMPVVSHDDDAMWRRILRFPFDNVTPPEKLDPNLTAILTSPEASSAVLAWAVKGCVEWYAKGLSIPDAVKTATATYKADSNPLAPILFT